MLANSSHRWSAAGVEGGATLRGAPPESANAGPFLELACQNAAGATRLAKVCRSASSNPGARRAGLARVPLSRGRGRVAADQPTPARAAGRRLCLAAVVGGIN